MSHGCKVPVCEPGLAGRSPTRRRLVLPELTATDLLQTPPRVDFCPGDLWVQANNGSTVVRWDEPRFSDDDKLMSVTEVNGEFGTLAGQCLMKFFSIIRGRKNIGD